MADEVPFLSAIEVDSLCKYYGAVKAVDDVSFSVREGEVFGFLGPNGAGKTTAIKVLTTLLSPTSGTVKVLGFDVVTSQAKEIRKRIGVVQQQESYESILTTEAALNLYGFLWDVPKDVRKQRIEEILRVFGLEDLRDVRAPEMSIGQRRRLQVGREFMHDMKLLFLDEPTIGLDPIARRYALDFFQRKVKEGLTIFFTTQIMEEAEYLCDRIAIIDRGKILTVDSPGGIKSRYGRRKAIEVTISHGNLDELASRLKKIESIEKVLMESASGSLKIITENPSNVFPHVIKILDELELTVSSVSLAQPSLEDVFIDLLENRSER